MQKLKKTKLYDNWLVVVEFVNVLVNLGRKVKNIFQIQIAHDGQKIFFLRSPIFLTIAKTVAKSKNTIISRSKLNLKVQNI